MYLNKFASQLKRSNNFRRFTFKLDPFSRKNEYIRTRYLSSIPNNDQNTSLINSDIAEISTNIAEKVAPTHDLSIYWPPDLVMTLIDSAHTYSGLPYWETIVAVTLTVRVLMLPLAIKTQQSTARMALMRPEMQKLQESYTTNPKFHTDNHLKKLFEEEMKALWKKYDCNPLRSLSLPLIQLPIFISFFTGLRNMHDFYPGFKTGGAYWFVDLASADTTFILPIVNAASFLIMVEIGADGMPANQANTMKIVMRALAVVMIPLTMNFSQGVFVYWSANNLFSIIQAFVLKQQKVREALNIPKMPDADVAPAMKISNPFVKYYEYAKKVKENSDANKIEVIDGIVKVSPPPQGSPKPVTFTQNPKFKKK